MKTHGKLLLASCAATLLLGLAVGSASATRLEVSTQGIRVVFLLTEPNGGGPLEMSNNVGLPTVRCSLTLEGTLHSRTITKTSGSLIGSVTRAGLGGCPLSIVAGSLPWHMRYQSFAGALPNITAMTAQIIGAGFSLATSGEPCRARTTAAQPATLGFGIAAGVFREVAVGGSIRFEGTGICGMTGTFGGTSKLVTILGSSSAISVRLI